MKIIGITGTLGAGKGTVVEYLVKEKNFKHYSVRAYLVDKIKQRGLPVNRDTMVAVANDLRSEHGPGFIVEELYRQAVEVGKDCIIESLRTPGEVTALRKKGDFVLLAVDATPNIRYQRVVGRGSETDNISFPEFLANEERELTSSDPNKQNLSACANLADVKLTNNGSKAELFTQLVQALDGLDSSEIKE